MSTEKELHNLRAQVEALEAIALNLANFLGEPQLLREFGGFRYDKPDVRHFCLLKAIRVVSALNACIELARLGYTQEIGTLLRTIAEFTTHIEYVLDPDDSQEHSRVVAEYVQAFFDDSRRDPLGEIKRAQIPQGKVHTALGRTLDNFTDENAQERVPAAALLSNVYRIFSNYVHGKYPEIMDLYGGRPGRFHLRGMSGTPKDIENLELLRTFVVTASNTFVLMIQRLSLWPLIESDPSLVNWYRGRHPNI